MEVTKDAFEQQYKIDWDNGFLGSGGSGKVYRAYSELRNRDVAIKLHENRGENLELISEVKRVINLQHDNIIQYYDAFWVKKMDTVEQLVVMEYADDGNLASMIGKIKDMDTFKSIVGHILKGLIYLRENQIVHMDIKPENILLKKTKKDNKTLAKIGDFGLAKTQSKFWRIQNNGEQKKSSGTPAYIAPEIISDTFAVLNSVGKPTTVYNTDLWSFGVMIYYLLKGKSPFGSEREQVHYKKILNNIIDTPIDTLGIGELPWPFNHMVSRCLIKDAKTRFTTAEELLDMLENRKKISIQHPPKPDRPIRVNKRDQTKRKS